MGDSLQQQKIRKIYIFFKLTKIDVTEIHQSACKLQRLYSTDMEELFASEYVHLNSFLNNLDDEK